MWDEYEEQVGQQGDDDGPGVGEPVTDRLFHTLPDSLAAPLLDVVPGQDSPLDSPTELLPALRDAVFGRRMTPTGITEPDLVLGAESFRCRPPDAGPRQLRPILRANPALLRLAGRDGDGVSGCSCPSWCSGRRGRAAAAAGRQPVRSGWSAGAAGRRPVGGPAGRAGRGRRTGRSRREHGRALDRGAGAPAAGRTLELRTGTGRLHRSDTLEELYRSIGVDANAPDSRAPEREQVALLCQSLRYGDGPRQHHVQVPLPGSGLMSCRAEVESAPDGTPLRIVGLVRDLSPEQVAQRRLGQSGQRFADLMDMVPGGVVLFDPTGRVVDASPGLASCWTFRWTVAGTPRPPSASTPTRRTRTRSARSTPAL